MFYGKALDDMRILWIEQGKDNCLKLVAPQTKNETHTNSQIAKRASQTIKANLENK